MYIQRNKSKYSKTGKVYTSVLLCSKYREGILLLYPSMLIGAEYYFGVPAGGVEK